MPLSHAQFLRRGMDKKEESTTEMEEMAARRRLVEGHQGWVGMEEQAACERDRQIQWFESNSPPCRRKS